MYKAIKDNKIIAVSDTDAEFPCLNKDNIVEDATHTAADYIEYKGEYVLQADYPIEERNEQIRAERQARYIEESDPLRLDYDEALARGQDNAEELKEQWLASKDKIREELPYIVTADKIEELKEEPITEGVENA